MQTGFPAKPAANVAKLAPGFEPSFSALAFVVAVVATAAWAWLVRWRTGRHRMAIWKSLVLPAGGAALCWLLLMTLWLPVLDFARSYTAMVRGVTRYIDQPGCVESWGLARSQVAALRYHGRLDVRPPSSPGTCPWRLVAPDLPPGLEIALDMGGWRFVANVRRPVDSNENLLLYRKAAGE